MFTGLVEELGEVLAFEQTRNGARLTIRSENLAAGTKLGESIAVNGCCLTVTSQNEQQLTFDLLNETLSKTNIGQLATGSAVNLEPALPASGRLGGHFVQGHIDCTTRVLSFTQHGTDWRLEIALPSDFAHYVVAKGSIAIDGISLTVAELSPTSLVVWIIPHTLAVTNLRTKNPGEFVNLEFDLLAKYVERMFAARE